MKIVLFGIMYLRLIQMNFYLTVNIIFIDSLIICFFLPERIKDDLISYKDDNILLQRYWIELIYYDSLQKQKSRIQIHHVKIFKRENT